MIEVFRWCTGDRAQWDFGEGVEGKAGSRVDPGKQIVLQKNNVVKVVRSC